MNDKEVKDIVPPMKLGGKGPHKMKRQLAQTPPLLYGLTFSCPRFAVNDPFIYEYFFNAHYLQVKYFYTFLIF